MLQTNKDGRDLSQYSFKIFSCKFIFNQLESSENSMLNIASKVIFSILVSDKGTGLLAEIVRDTGLLVESCGIHFVNAYHRGRCFPYTK